jgi:hypothetical protein
MRNATGLGILAALVLSLPASPVRGEDPARPAGTPATPLSDKQLKQHLTLVRGAGFYGLRDPEEAKAVAELRKHPAQAAPELARMLAEGHQNRKRGWIEVYRPMYIMEGMGRELKVAVPEIAKALDDAHGINVGQAAELLTEIGPDAKEAMPALKKAWDKVEASTLDASRKTLQKNMLAKAMLAVDAEAAKAAGVEVVPAPE